MSDIVSLEAEIRDSLGTGSARALRRSGKIPATIYGANKEPLSISVAEKEMTKYYRLPQFITQVFELEIGGKKHKVLPKDVQLHPVNETVTHVDFVFIEKDVQKLKVPVVYKNKENCLGVKRGGYFNVVLRTLPITCPVGALPRKIEIDVINHPVGSRIKAGDAKLPDGAKLLIKPEFVISSIIGKRGKSTEEENPEAAGAEATGGAAS